jgi:FtsH-binding integral membrane protein
MIEFIVLGKIPGTEVYITFNWLIVVVVAGLIIYDLKTIKHKKTSGSKNQRKNITAKS